MRGQGKGAERDVRVWEARGGKGEEKGMKAGTERRGKSDKKGSDSEGVRESEWTWRER